MTNKKLLKLLVDCFKPFSLLFSLIALLLMTNINSFPQHHLFPTFFFLNSFISFSCAYAIASCWINNPHHEQRRQRWQIWDAFNVTQIFLSCAIVFCEWREKEMKKKKKSVKEQTEKIRYSIGTFYYGEI